MTGQQLYEPVGRSRLYEKVAEQIETMIRSRRIKAGDRLPSERELGAFFRVSRTVVREALKHLEARGLAETLTGNGIFVATPRTSLVSQAVGTYLDLQAVGRENALKLHELRRIVEREVAALAAERATPEERAELKHILDRMDSPQIAGEAGAMLDLQFHLALVQATHNEMLSLIFAPILDCMRRHFIAAWEQDTRPRKAVHAEHRAICNAVCAGDPARARQAVEKHLSHSARVMDHIRGEEAPQRPRLG